MPEKRLVDLVPSYAGFMDLEPEELAGVLLVWLNSLDMPDGYDTKIAYTTKQFEDYPDRDTSRMSFAVMEAWACLTREGMIAVGPGFSDEYFTTRRGKQIVELKDWKEFRRVATPPTKRFDGPAGDTIDLRAAAVILGLPEFLVRDFVSYEFNGRKLPTGGSGRDKDGYAFHAADVVSYKAHLESRWPGIDRIPPPEFVERYLAFEAKAACAFCRVAKPNYQSAHIVPWAKTRCHSPHNLLRLCLDCHTSHGSDVKLLRGVKEELLRLAQIIPQVPVYDCDTDLAPGEAVYVLNGRAFRADARDHNKLATAFVRTKVGPDRCVVQRSEVLEAFGGLEPGAKYVLSRHDPGRVVTYKEFVAGPGSLAGVFSQEVGRAESPTQLAIMFGFECGLSD